MSTEPMPPVGKVSGGRLWFGFGAAFVCWFGIGIADVLITWRECLHEEAFGLPSRHPGLLALNIILFLALLAISIAAGILSYRNWHILTEEKSKNVFEAKAYQSREYVAMIGVIMSVALTIGTIWFGLPLFIIQLCSRVR